MKSLRCTLKTILALALAVAVFSLAATPASAGLFNRRPIVVVSPNTYVTPVETLYAAPVSTVVATPVTTVYPMPATTVVEPGLTPTAYVPTVAPGMVSTPVTTTYVPTVSTVPSIVTSPARVRVVYPRRVYWYGY